MPNGILKLSPIVPGSDNIGTLHLGTVIVPKPVSQSVSIVQAGMPPIMNLALDLGGITTTNPGWASITMVVLGTTTKSGMMLPVPMETGLPYFPFPPPPGLGLIFLPAIADIALAATKGVTVVGAGRVVGLPLPGMAAMFTSIPPTVIDCFSTPGSQYKLQFIVVPTGITGLHKTVIPLKSDMGPQGKIIISANVIPAASQENQNG
jgi:hypothetical protein